MIRRKQPLLLAVILIGLMFAADSGLAAAPPPFKLELVTAKLDEPVHVNHAGDGSSRLFVVEKKGRVVIVRDGVVEPRPFLDIRHLVQIDHEEQGLLSVAFHPSYASNGFFFVQYTPGPGRVRVARYKVSENRDIADPGSAMTLLEVQKKCDCHNGGLVAFGPDGYLYVGFGDGTFPLDSEAPGNDAQNKAVLLGKLLRLDVDGGMPYAIPPDNPFVDEPGARPEIWAYGLRNPWRFSFDQATGDLYIADVGRRTREEINLQRAGSSGQNYGWNLLEGRECYLDKNGCDSTPFEAPIYDYRRADMCAIVGGHVYRGLSIPGLVGRYIHADFCRGWVWALEEGVDGEWRAEELLQAKLLISSFGEDWAGELYLTSVLPGGLYRLAAGS